MRSGDQPILSNTAAFVWEVEKLAVSTYHTLRETARAADSGSNRQILAGDRFMVDLGEVDGVATNNFEG